jgi:hypothetical protein
MLGTVCPELHMGCNLAERSQRRSLPRSDQSRPAATRITTAAEIDAHIVGSARDHLASMTGSAATRFLRYLFRCIITIQLSILGFLTMSFRCLPGRHHPDLVFPHLAPSHPSQNCLHTFAIRGKIASRMQVLLSCGSGTAVASVLTTTAS